MIRLTGENVEANVTAQFFNSDYQYLIPFSDAMDATNNCDELVACFAELVNRLGMTRFELFEISSVGLCWRKQLVIGTFPESFLDRFWKERRTFDSAFIRYARLHGRPFKAGQVMDSPNLNWKERENIKKTIADGFTDGVIFPLKGRFNRISLLAIAGDSAVLSQSQIRMLSYLSQHFYHRACALTSDAQDDNSFSDPGVLTNRERECLTWVGLGKTDWEIGKILSISKRTVRYHIENAVNKLEASSRLQAVIMAMRNVEILL